MIIDDIEKSFHNPTLFTSAITLANGKRGATYERLEFLGDKVLGFILTEMLYNAFPKENEGDLSIRYISLAKEETLAMIARQIGVPNRLITNENILRDNNSVLSDVCEALVAALYLDQGMAAAQDFVKAQFTPFMYADISAVKDIKSQLQEFAQKKYKIIPVYSLVSQSGSEHAPIFTMKVAITQNLFATGSGHNKKEAEKIAAQTLLDTLQSPNPTKKALS